MRTGFSIILSAALLLTGCSSAKWAGIHNPLYDPPSPSSASKEAPPDLRAPHRIALLNSPRQLQSEFAYPPLITQQALVWSEKGLDWRIRFPPRRYAYAGVRLRAPINFDSHKDRMNLVFRIQPASMAHFLFVALVDKPERDLPALSDVPLAKFAPETDDGWQTVKIPLSAFKMGEILDANPGEHDLGLETHIHDNRPLDWTRIQEIRFISPGANIPARQISIQDLRIQRK